MDKLGDMLGVIAKRAENANPPEEGDYYDDDGFLCCGKCHTRRQVELTMPSGDGTTVTRKVMSQCKCREEQRKADDLMREKEREMERIKSLRGQSLMDKRMKEATFANAKETSKNARNLRLCRRYAEHFDEMLAKNQGLLLYGEVGTGKSYAAACIANYLLDKRTPVVMTSFVKLLDTMQGFKEDDELIDRLNRAKLLIIDDLGAERSTDFALEKVYSIIDSRYRASLPIVLTTNLDLEQMKSQTDIRYSRIYDRIFELCYPLQFTGASWRKTEAARRFESMKEFLEGSDG